MIQDYMVHRFMRERGGKVSKQEILEALGKDEESRRAIEEKLMMMARFGIVAIEGDIIPLK